LMTLDGSLRVTRTGGLNGSDTYRTRNDCIGQTVRSGTRFPRRPARVDIERSSATRPSLEHPALAGMSGRSEPPAPHPCVSGSPHEHTIAFRRRSFHALQLIDDTNNRRVNGSVLFTECF